MHCVDTSFPTQFEAKTVIGLHFLHTCAATSWYYHTFCTVWNLKLRYDHMFCIVFEPKLWYYHQYFIVWKSKLWCFCIFCVVLEAKLWNYHMFWHFSSILHRVDHHFIMNMLFFLQSLHILTPIYRPPFGKLEICCGKLAFGQAFTSQIWHKPRGKEKNMAFIPVLHQPKAKGLAVPARKRKWQALSKRNVHHVRNPRLQDVAAPVQSHGIKVCTKPRHASNMCSYREISSHCF